MFTARCHAVAKVFWFVYHVAMELQGCFDMLLCSCDTWIFFVKNCLKILQKMLYNLKVSWSLICYIASLRVSFCRSRGLTWTVLLGLQHWQLLGKIWCCSETIIGHKRISGKELRGWKWKASYLVSQSFIMRSETDQISWRGLLKLFDIVLFPAPPCSQCICGPDQSCALYYWFNLNKTSCSIKEKSHVKKPAVLWVSVEPSRSWSSMWRKGFYLCAESKSLWHIY